MAEQGLGQGKRERGERERERKERSGSGTRQRQTTTTKFRNTITTPNYPPLSLTPQKICRYYPHPHPTKTNSVFDRDLGAVIS